jgi:hypothetical protein
MPRIQIAREGNALSDRANVSSYFPAPNAILRTLHDEAGSCAPAAVSSRGITAARDKEHGPFIPMPDASRLQPLDQPAGVERRLDFLVVVEVAEYVAARAAARRQR